MDRTDAEHGRKRAHEPGGLQGLSRHQSFGADGRSHCRGRCGALVQLHGAAIGHALLRGEFVHRRRDRRSAVCGRVKGDPVKTLREVVFDCKTQYLRDVLAEAGGRRGRAAEIAGYGRTAFLRLLVKHGIHNPHRYKRGNAEWQALGA